MKSKNSHNATSLPALVVGPTRSVLLRTPTTNRSGLVRVRASLSARQAKDAGVLTSATYGPPSPGSSASASLQQSLASKLQAVTDVHGSPEYKLTWKEWNIARRQPICALRASARRTSDSGYSGWPTATASDGRICVTEESALRRLERKGLVEDLPTASQLVTGYPTPATPSGGKSIDHVAEWRGSTPYNAKGQKIQMDTQAVARMLTGYPTPRTPSGGPEPKGATGRKLETVAVQLGENSDLSEASTEKRGALNPDLSRWLMGYPDAWGSCGGTAMLLCLKSRKPS